jgi:DNA-binding IclR family transcriptional regulator
MGKNSVPDYYVKSVIQAFQILELINDNQSQMTLTEIAESLGEGKSKIHRFLNTLRHLGYIDKDPFTKKYGMSTKISRLGRWRTVEQIIIASAQGSLDFLAEKTSETINLGVLDGSNVYYLDKRDSPHPFRLTVDIGGRAPAHATAIGKSMLAFLTERNLNSLYEQVDDLKQYTNNTITSFHKLQEEFVKIREDGVAYDNEELFLGLRCVAAPIFRRGDVVGAISISIPASRIDATRFELFRDLLIEEVRELNKKLDTY